MHDIERLAARVGALVHVSQRVRHDDADRDGLGPAHAHTELTRAPTNLTQVPSLDELDHDIRLTGAVIGSLEDLSDTRMLELRLDAGLVQKARQKGTVLFVFATDGFHDTRPFGAFDPAGGSPIDLAHAAAGDPLEQRVTFKATRQGITITGRILL